MSPIPTGGSPSWSNPGCDVYTFGTSYGEKVLKPFFISGLFLVLTCCPLLGGAQKPFNAGPHPRLRGTLPGVIVFERKEKPAFAKLSEFSVFTGTVGQDPAVRRMRARVTRISRDSIWLGKAGFHFTDLGEVRLSGNCLYKRSDSLNWKVIFPPVEIYRDYRVYSKYLHGISARIRNVKASRLSALGFKNQVKVNLTKLANLEIAFSFERRIQGPVSLELETGFQFAGENTMTDDFFMGLYPLYKYSGVNFVFGPKYYIGKIPYVQIFVIYRYLFMDDSRSKFAVENGHYALQYQYRNDIGGGFRFGLLTRVGRSGVLDAYIGGGLKVCMVNQFIYGYFPYDQSSYYYWLNPEHSAENYHVSLLKPVFNAGIKIGVGI